MQFNKGKKGNLIKEPEASSEKRSLKRKRTEDDEGYCLMIVMLAYLSISSCYRRMSSISNNFLVIYWLLVIYSILLYLHCSLQGLNQKRPSCLTANWQKRKKKRNERCRRKITNLEAEPKACGSNYAGYRQLHCREFSIFYSGCIWTFNRVHFDHVTSTVHNLTCSFLCSVLTISKNTLDFSFC